MSYVHSGQKSYACGCIGPQNGDPLCPCAMRSVVVEDGRYVQRIDLGPVAPKQSAADLVEKLRILHEFKKYD